MVHFAGHSLYDAEAPVRSGWRLADGVLTATEIAQLHPPPRLVFSNSCEAAAGGPWDGRLRRTGVRHRQRLPARRRRQLRRHVLGRARHGEPGLRDRLLPAPRRGRSPRRRPAGGAYGGRGDARGAGLTWASYVLYGDPGYRPFPLGVDAQPSVPRATRKREPARFTVSLGGATGTPTVGRAAETPHLVGRTAELTRLDAALAEARAGTVRWSS